MGLAQKGPRIGGAMKFETAMAFTAKWEGGFVNDPKDPGGATKYGISLRFLRSIDKKLGDTDGDGDVDAADVMGLDEAAAHRLYRAFFWEPLAIDYTPGIIALALFDTAVNMGKARAVKILQGALNSFGQALEIDGDYGPATKAAVLECVSARNGFVGDRFCLYRLQAYADIVAANTKLSRYTGGWMNRTLDLAREMMA